MLLIMVSKLIDQPVVVDLLTAVISQLLPAIFGKNGRTSYYIIAADND